jgi:hypothetical protein
LLLEQSLLEQGLAQPVMAQQSCSRKALHQNGLQMNGQCCQSPLPGSPLPTRPPSYAMLASGTACARPQSAEPTSAVGQHKCHWPVLLGLMEQLPAALRMPPALLLSAAVPWPASELLKWPNSQWP